MRSKTDSIDSPDALLWPSDVADLLGVTPRTITRYAATGMLPAVTLPSGHRRYRSADVEAVLATADRPGQ